MEYILKAASEAKEALIGSRIDKVWSLDEYTFVFAIRSRKKDLFLVISVLKRSKRFHLFFDPVSPDYLYKSPKTEIISKHIRRGTIIDLGLSNGCVIVEILHGEIYRLIADFEKLNIILRDRDERTLIALHHRSVFKEAKIEEAFFPRISFSTLSVNKELDQKFREERNSWLRKDILKIVRAEEKKTRRLVDKLLGEEKEVEKKEKYRMCGELLKYNLNKINRGAKKVLLKDFYGNYTEVELHPGLSPAQNMERYFKLYRKLVKKENILTRRIEDQYRRLEWIRRLHKRIEEGTLVGLDIPFGLLLESEEVLMLGRGFVEKLKSCLPGGAVKKRPESKKGLRVFLSESGKSILVGRSARENDELVRRVARGNDIWFHAEDTTGAHVILRYEKQKEFTEEDIRDACMLALHYSRLKKAGGGDVVYTRCKWVRKPKGAKTGAVLYSNNRTRYVKYDENVIKRLFDRALSDIKIT